MRARFYFSATLLILIVTQVHSAATSLSDMGRSEQMAATIRAYTQQFNLSKASLAEGDGSAIQKCGLGTALTIRSLISEYGKLDGFEGVADRPSPTDFPLTFDSPSGHFKIHYTRTAGDIDRIDESYGDQNTNGIPDYPEIVARIADSCWEHHISELGYRVPINDAPFGGGDSRYDIYLRDVGANYYGVTWPDQGVQAGNMVLATSWIELDTRYQDYTNYGTRPIEALQVTLAHEFFHSIHLAYDAQEPCTDENCTPLLQNPYWLEMSAVWMEEETYDNVNDYYYYLEYYMPNVHRAPYYISEGGLSIYGAGIFGIFLHEKYGRDVIRKSWERCGQVPGENFFSGAIQGALDEVSSGAVNLEIAWTEYSRWLFFTGTRTRTGRYFSEAANYEMVPETSGNPPRPYIRTYSEYPITLQQSADNGFSVSELGINYLDFRTGTIDSAFTMRFVGVQSTDPPTEWRLSVIAYDRFNSNGVFRPHNRLYLNLETIQEKDLDAITDILVIPTIVNPELNRISNTYRFEVSDSSIHIAENTIRFANSKFYTSMAGENPFAVIFELAARSDVDFSVYTVAGEKVYQSPSITVESGELRPLTWLGVNADNEDVASGVYIVQARIGDELIHHKILVVR